MSVGGDSLAHVCPRCRFDMGGERTPRSHRYLHAVIAAAHENWPERHSFQPTCSAHLRAWLFCHPSVEFCGTIDGPVDGLSMFQQLMGEAAGQGFRAFIGPDGAGGMRLRIPRTSAMAAKGGPKRGAFYSLVDRVLGAIEAETGIPREDLRREGLSAVAPRPRLGKRKAA